MRTRPLGATGPAVSVVGLGCNNFGMRIDAAASAVVVRAALDAGITHFDTAEMYGGGRSEEFLGAALGARRDEAVIATKVMRRPKGEPYAPGILRRRILEGCEGSLRRLGTDRIDVYYQHFVDVEGSNAEAMEALDELVRAGKVLHLACSNVTAAEIEERAAFAAERGIAAFTAAQIEWSLLNRAVEAEIAPAAVKTGMGIVPYFPLASGLLSGKYAAGQPFPEGTRLASAPYFAQAATPENFAYIDELTAFARERGHTILELAVAWLAAQTGVSSVIAGATRPEQVAANAAAASWELTPADLAALPQPPAAA
ncbi:aldo/keto reductase [Frankia sp. CNm7]|uniref:Aldo/keto reductase n=1 Tax=Frankia nepalensis TaxID=1836974 RepID=A0A937RP05_9ACTN|nr:aldo/keto reductase [Frankia nepalensis]MBL7495879.1 aldo/keto reductase [Frankia nepalensis]MBL7510394.1 aldo/keto reductase [Frankia nepalensis]MBL7518628.1 aldo/keto reductase [Frankia nepalensis]MBL7629993.1 aldo/keto reductase [Frankia nepalensis]